MEGKAEHDITVFDDASNKLERHTLLNTNARSLCPKIDSLIDNINELECTFAVITETWLNDGEYLEQGKLDLQDGEGLSIITRNRKLGNRGVAHGGVCVMARESRAKMAPFRFHNPGNFEVLPVVASLKGHTRKLLLVACYMPPSMNSESSTECMDLIVEVVHRAKGIYDSPHVVVCGDFNQFRIDRALQDHPDLKECPVGPTRDAHSIDRIFATFDAQECGTVAPLQPNEDQQGSDSDHMVAYVRAVVTGREANPWVSHTYRPKTEAGCERFKQWIINEEWTSVLHATTANEKAEAYQTLVEKAMNECFPER